MQIWFRHGAMEWETRGMPQRSLFNENALTLQCETTQCHSPGT